MNSPSSSSSSDLQECGNSSIFFRRTPFLEDYVVEYKRMQRNLLRGDTGVSYFYNQGVLSISNDLIDRLSMAYFTRAITLDTFKYLQRDIYLRQGYHWMGLGIISDAIKDQKSYGCCGEMAMTELLAAYLFIEECGVMPLEQLSVQELIDHTKFKRAETCRRLAEYVIEKGLCTESVYPFKGPKNDRPLHLSGIVEKVKCDAFSVVENPTFYRVIEHIRRCGPLLSSMFLTRRFEDFRKPIFGGEDFSVEDGIYSHDDNDTDFLEESDGSARVAHAVLIVGYDEETGSLKIKNTHGTNWGNQGLGKISFSCFQEPFLYPRRVHRVSVPYDY